MTTSQIWDELNALGVTGDLRNRVWKLIALVKWEAQQSARAVTIRLMESASPRLKASLLQSIEPGMRVGENIDSDGALANEILDILDAASRLEPAMQNIVNRDRPEELVKTRRSEVDLLDDNGEVFTVTVEHGPGRSAVNAARESEEVARRGLKYMPRVVTIRELYVRGQDLPQAAT